MLKIYIFILNKKNLILNNKIIYFNKNKYNYNMIYKILFYLSFFSKLKFFKKFMFYF